MTPMQVLAEAVRVSAVPAGQVAADCLVLPAAEVLALIESARAGRLRVERNHVRRDRRRGDAC